MFSLLLLLEVGYSLVDMQYDALVQFYDSTDGANWMSNNWLQSDVYCDWIGVSCDDNDNVVSINVQHMGLNGQLSDLTNLTYLSSLYLSGNNLKDSDLCLLGGLSYLRVLDMTDTSLDGNIPECICALSKLHSLHLDNNSLIGDVPPCLGDSQQLGLKLFTARCNRLQYSFSHLDLAVVDYVDLQCNPTINCGGEDYVVNRTGYYACGLNHCSTCVKKTTCAAFLDVGGCRYYLRNSTASKIQPPYYR